jgi:hypothetical protein
MVFTERLEFRIELVHPVFMRLPGQLGNPLGKLCGPSVKYGGHEKE